MKDRWKRLLGYGALAAAATGLLVVGAEISEARDVTTADLRFSLSCRMEQRDGRRYPRFDGVLLNFRSTPVTLVQPGDGSEHGWRTPVVYWRVNGQLQGRRGRCGNMNSLEAGEVFELPAGARRSLADWFGAPYLPGPGHYRVSCLYRNDPRLASEWGPSDIPEAFVRSTRVAVESNSVDVIVPAPDPR